MSKKYAPCLWISLFSKTKEIRVSQEIFSSVEEAKEAVGASFVCWPAKVDKNGFYTVPADLQKRIKAGEYDVRRK